MNNEILKFLHECSIIKSKHYDNSLEIPKALLDKYKNSINIENMNNIWRNYLRVKFHYYVLLLEENKEEADNKIYKELEDEENEYLRNYVKKWKRQFSKEKIVYKYRKVQLPTIIENWYYSTNDDCFKWITNLDSEIKDLNKKVLASSWIETLRKNYEKINDKPYSNYQQEHELTIVYKEIITSLLSRINSFHGFLSKTSKSLYEITTRTTEDYDTVLQQISDCIDCYKRYIPTTFALPDDQILFTLSHALLESLITHGFQEVGVLLDFLTTIKDYFHCEVCDYLEVTGNNEKLEWKVATVGLKGLSTDLEELSESEKRERIKKEETYEINQGITGSVLLLPNEDKQLNILTHIGSNDVRHDPRDSTKHLSAYEKKMYPNLLKYDKIFNFWIFPIYNKGKLVGAFRVVNKTDINGDLEPGGWPYYTRVQLAIIALWLSRFIEIVRFQGAEDFVRIMKINSEINKLRIFLNLQWIDESIFQQLVKHIEKNISRKHEKRSVGCCFFIVHMNGNGKRLLKKLDNYPFLNCNEEDIVAPYNDLELYYDAVNPLLGTFIFDENGNFNRIARLEVKDGNKVLEGYRAIEYITSNDDSIVCLILPCGENNIMLFMGGKKVAEVHISERTGDWRFRRLESILDKLKHWAPEAINKDILIDVRDVCVELSSKGYGAIIVVGDYSDDKLSLGDEKSIKYKTELPLKEMGNEYLVELAKQDGATFISKAGIVTAVNRNVTVSNIPKKYKTHFPDRGLRHETGEKISWVSPEALVIIISENRGISIMKPGGEDVEKDL